VRSDSQRKDPLACVAAQEIESPFHSGRDVAVRLDERHQRGQIATGTGVSCDAADGCDDSTE
jgi:hypothetical protein